MRLEYFQLIDRIVDLKIADRKISTEATVPVTSTIFEGHFPGFPLMPGVLLIEAMAQTSGWLIVASHHFQRMAFLAAVKDAKFRMFVTPGQKLSVKASLDARGLRLRDHKGKHRIRWQADLRRNVDASRARFSERRNETPHARGRRASRLPGRGAGRWLRAPGKSGSPGSGSFRVSVKVPMRIGKS